MRALFQICHSRGCSSRAPFRYATGSDIDDMVVRLHDAFAAETAPHNPILLLVDTNFTDDNLSIKAFVRTHLGVPPEDRGSIFTRIPCDAKFFDAERTGRGL